MSSSTKAEVFVTRKISPAALQRIAEAANLEVWQGAGPPPYDELLKLAQGKDGILSLLSDKIDRNFILTCSPRLKIISQMAVGYDNIDIQAATEVHLPVGNTPGVLTETTADLAWALLMACARRVVEADKQVRTGIWLPWGPDVLTGQEIFGSTIGIIGFGRIGQAMARRAKGFGMKILYYDRQINPEAEEISGAIFTPLDQLLSTSDFISLHTNLNETTDHLINQRALEKMQPHTILINTSRGKIIDSEALYQSLKEKRIQAAGLDVFDPEPIPASHPLLALDNVVLTPHIASASTQTRTRMAMIAAENLIAGLQNKRLPFCANPEVYKM